MTLIAFLSLVDCDDTFSLFLLECYALQTAVARQWTNKFVRCARLGRLSPYHTTLRSFSVILRKSAYFIDPLGTPTVSFPLASVMHVCKYPSRRSAWALFFHKGAEVGYFACWSYGRSRTIYVRSGYILWVVRFTPFSPNLINQCHSTAPRDHYP